MPDLPENPRPNVLTVEEAALLVKANEQPRPDSDEEAARFSAILDRLAEWAEQPEQARVVAKTYEVQLSDVLAEQANALANEDDEGWREATDEEIAAGDQGDETDG